MGWASYRPIWQTPHRTRMRGAMPPPGIDPFDLLSVTNPERLPIGWLKPRREALTFAVHSSRHVEDLPAQLPAARGAHEL
ncbi:hypothetical protein RRG08_009424 [Elysia crispata]|uniref:Uncharacterized protein n=1 Tax=Elysia crispata TaxID=231223 RepID=A0AAE0Y8X8_9GAST|nr:hypothetical protein RRG08_009424 [Elysia crispata]